MRPGDPFPSVRTLSKELRINPNTAHKVVMQLVREGLARKFLSGQGTVVSTRPTPGATERSRLLREEMEKLVVEAKKLGTGTGRRAERSRALLAAIGEKVNSQRRPKEENSRRLSDSMQWSFRRNSGACGRWMRLNLEVPEGRDLCADRVEWRGKNHRDQNDDEYPGAGQQAH